MELEDLRFNGVPDVGALQLHVQPVGLVDLPLEPVTRCPPDKVMAVVVVEIV